MIAIGGVVIFSLNSTGMFSETLIASGVKLFDKNDRADSIVVRFIQEHINKEEKYYTFSKIGFVKSSTPKFMLESVPTKDKKPYYEFIEKHYNNGLSKSFTVEIDILAGDGSKIETLQYKKCQVESYFVYVNDSKGKFSLTGESISGMEIRDVTKFECTTFSIIV